VKAARADRVDWLIENTDRTVGSLRSPDDDWVEKTKPLAFPSTGLCSLHSAARLSVHPDAYQL
jgi:hypothetical protein